MDQTKTYASSFSDITGAQWYANAVGYMEQYHIVSGYPDGTFAGDKPITRAEFAIIASRFDELAQDAVNTFTDVEDHHWAAKYIASASKKSG